MKKIKGMQKPHRFHHFSAQDKEATRQGVKSAAAQTSELQEENSKESAES